MANEYLSGINLNELMVNTKAATVFAAHEASLFLGGALIPASAVPAGSRTLQVPKLGSVSATTLSSAESNTDLLAQVPADNSATINVDLIAARSVVRDLGGIDTNDIGRVLGESVSADFDAKVMTAIGDLTAQEVVDTNGELTMSEIFKAVGTLRNAKVGGQLYGIIGTGTYAEFMDNVGSNSAFAGGDFQTEALRNGFLATIAGVQFFVSAYLDDTNTGVTGAKAAIFGRDAMRIALQKGVDLEVERRAAAVGFDVVASLHAGVGVVDAARGVMIHNAV